MGSRYVYHISNVALVIDSLVGSDVEVAGIVYKCFFITYGIGKQTYVIRLAIY